MGKRSVVGTGDYRVDGWTGDETPKRGVGIVPTLRASQGGEGVGVILGPGRLRKLTVREWERLQGFPDDYTLIDCGEKPASDRARRKAVGNSFPPPMLRWLGEGIEEYEARVEPSGLA